MRSHAQTAAIIAAVAKLLLIATYMSIMTMLGFKLRRIRAPQPARTPRASPLPPHAAPKPRRKHRYMNRDYCLALLAEANEAARGAIAPEPPAFPTPQSSKLQPPAPTSRRTPAPPPATPTSASAHPPIAATLHRPPPHPPPARKTTCPPSRLRTPISLRYQNELHPPLPPLASPRVRLWPPQH